MQPDLVKEFIGEFHAEINRCRQEKELRHESKRRELPDVTRKLDDLIDAIADGLRTPSLKSKLEDLERRKAELEQELASAAVPVPRIHPNLAELYRRKVESLHQALSDPATRDEALQILQGLIERVVLHPVENEFEIELVGEIANMVRLPAGAESLNLDRYRSSVKVVAGAGFEPATFRL